MQVKETEFDGILLLTPTLDFMWPVGATALNFPDCCGAGNGLGNYLVPDTFYGLCVSAACWIHDQMFTLAEATWKSFYFCNEIFLENLKRIIHFYSSNFVMRQLREIRAYEYFAAVALPGSICFWNPKRKQGMI